ncbi:hypothetical protein NGM10_15940 (plasmid) [Halorussus salilacus]|uniref:Rid family hydrolase n=1 Tax=Halorussus salilacus TaxID=2953750 RepID=UPI00209F40D3|nr:Rid family hydrolase [Halorussus salilacus]USZ69895.1 hypothetical protein NGM10_15940 [Halorussus salilacus]
MQVIETDDAPEPGGAYSQGIVGDGRAYVSGQVGLDPETGDLAGDGGRGRPRRSLPGRGRRGRVARLTGPAGERGPVSNPSAIRRERGESPRVPGFR